MSQDGVIISGQLVNSVIYTLTSPMTPFAILHVTLFCVATHITCLQSVKISGLMVYGSPDIISHFYVS